MNQQSSSGNQDDLREFRDLKTQFDGFKKELHDIHEQWLRIHDGTSNNHGRHDELIDREMIIYGELNQLMKSITEVLGRNLERSRKVLVTIGNRK